MTAGLTVRDLMKVCSRVDPNAVIRVTGPDGRELAIGPNIKVGVWDEVPGELKDVEEYEAWLSSENPLGLISVVLLEAKEDQ